MEQLAKRSNPKPEPEGRAEPSFLRRLLLVAAVAAGALLVIRLADVLLLVFAAILVAILLHAVATPLRRHTPLGRTASLAVAVVALAAAAGAVGWAFGQQFETQLSSLATVLPPAWADLKLRLAESEAGLLVLEQLAGLPGPDGGWLSLAPRYAVDAATLLAATVIVTFAGVYLAFHPRTYSEGLLRLFPATVRPRAAEVLAAIDEALRRWLLGQMISMVLVGATTALGLWAVGVPSPVGLGVVAGLGQLVPVVGPMAAAIPGLIVALSEGPTTFVLAAVVYLAAVQLEANLITPLVLRRMAEVPMAVTLFAVLAMGVLLGPLGVLFATPLAVVAYVLIRKVYVEGVLGDPLDPPRSS